MSGDYAIDARGVVKDYGEGALVYRALKGVDLRVRTGEFVMLAGPSGSGKTTLLSIVGCVLSATAGDVVIDGVHVTGKRESEMPMLRLGRIGFIFQGMNLIGSLSAEENVALVLEMRGTPRKKALADAAAILGRVGLGEKRKSLPRDLSGGQRQRVAVARALAGDPPIILADEPTAALDAESGRVVTELLREVAKERGGTVVVVTHDNRIFHLADRIVHIEDGLITDGDGAHA